MPEMNWEQVKETLLFNPPNGYDRISDTDKAELDVYCDQYIQFVDKAKTERIAVKLTVEAAKKAGFVEFNPEMKLASGTKVYHINRQKAVFFAVIGEKSLDCGARIAASHIDSPRLDLKPNPLYEEGELALLKTHYFGGIKKYQWTAIPLAIHGVLALTDGSVLNVEIGENPGDPVFCVTDLLPHLGAEQMKKSLAAGISGENLNILFGSQPVKEVTGTDRVKLGVMMLLHEKYGIIEEDFLSAELSLVPAFPAREVGLDRSMIGAYGHDDRVCAYATLYPMLHMTEAPAHTAVCILADKEEIGSEGVTGMQSQAFDTFMDDLCNCQGASLRKCFANSVCLSADVAAAFDPTYSEVFEKRNSARLNHGVAICKYTGARGKSGASDASGEVMARFRRAFSRGEVDWQVTELGKVDAGGGGTVAKYMANRNIDTLDAGVAVLSMHAPYEIVSKLDCFMTMKASRVFYSMD
ncbi:MAG: aminopeptidase [Eubacteriales bacterium]